MTRVCIDTHALIWHVARPNRLGHSARRILRQVDAGKAVALIPVIAVRDPFDRMILAAARISETPLVTADAAIHESALVQTIWD